MKKEKNMLRISYNNEQREADSCPFWKPVYCNHPQQQDKQKLECRYGLTEICVPDKCPLREKPTTTMIELLIEEIEI